MLIQQKQHVRTDDDKAEIDEQIMNIRESVRVLEADAQKVKA